MLKGHDFPSKTEFNINQSVMLCYNITMINNDNYNIDNSNNNYH